MGSLRGIRSEATREYRKRKKRRSWQSVLANRFRRAFSHFPFTASTEYENGEVGGIFVFWSENEKPGVEFIVREVMEKFWDDKKKVYPGIELILFDMSTIVEGTNNFLIIDKKTCPR